MLYAQVLYQEMVHLQELNESLLYKTLHRFSVHFETLFFLNALIINVIMLVAFQYKDKVCYFAPHLQGCRAGCLPVQRQGVQSYINLITLAIRLESCCFAECRFLQTPQFQRGS